MADVKKSRRGRPTQSQLDARKAKVLKVAEALYLSEGFAGTTVSEIAKRSRVSTRLITAHFGDKMDILTEVIKERNGQALLLADETSEGETLEEILFGAAKFAWITAYSPGAISFLRLLVGEGSRLSDSASDMARKSSAHFFAAMEAIFQRLIDRGLIAPNDTQRLAKYFVDLIVGFSLVQAGMNYWDRVPDDDELRDKIHFFKLALEAGSARSEGDARAPIAPITQRGDGALH